VTHYDVWLFESNKELLMSKLKVPVFLSTVIICPNCGRAIDILPPAMEEAISDGDKLTCVACNADLIIRIQVPARAAEQRNGAERAGAYPCEIEGCKNKAVLHYCEEHDQ
jgi:hypothetical protein